MTAIDLITRALRLAGVYGQNEIVSAADLSDSFAVLNEMIDSWNTSRLYLYQVMRSSIPAVGGQQVYTVGPGGDFDVTRATQLTGLVITIGGVDYTPLQMNRSNFNSIPVKAINGIPQAYDYEPDFPLGKLYLWPTASEGTLSIEYAQQLTRFATPSTNVDFPPGYEQALRLSLAVALSQEFRMPVPPDVERRAANSVRRLRRLNVSIPTMDARPMQGRAFDIYSGI